MKSEDIFVIGLDGGGTKVEAVLLDGAGNVLARGLGGPANMSFVSRDTADQSISDALAFLASANIDFARVSAIGSCFVSGAPQVEEMVREKGFTGKCARFSEYQVAFRRAGLNTRAGIAVIAGTGSTFRGWNKEGEHISVGGWGMVVGDEGSAFDIGLRAIKAIGRSIDGRGAKTCLTDLVLREAGVENFHHLLKDYCRPLKQREIAGLAKLVSQAAAAGDETSRNILVQTAQSLADDIMFVAGKLFRKDEQFDVALSGGVFNAGDMIVNPLEEYVKREFPLVTFHVPKMSAGEAVAHLVLEATLARDSRLM